VHADGDKAVSARCTMWRTAPDTWGTVWAASAASVPRTAKVAKDAMPAGLRERVTSQACRTRLPPHDGPRRRARARYLAGLPRDNVRSVDSPAAHPEIRQRLTGTARQAPEIRLLELAAMPHPGEVSVTGKQVYELALGGRNTPSRSRSLVGNQRDAFQDHAQRAAIRQHSRAGRDERAARAQSE
jgi:hypothetical protein